MKRKTKKIAVGVSVLGCGIALAVAQRLPADCNYITTYSYNNVCVASGTVLWQGPLQPPCTVPSSIVTAGDAYAPQVQSVPYGGEGLPITTTVTTVVPVVITRAIPWMTNPPGGGCTVETGYGDATVSCTGTSASGYCPLVTGG